MPVCPCYPAPDEARHDRGCLPVFKREHCDPEPRAASGSNKSLTMWWWSGDVGF